MNASSSVGEAVCLTLCQACLRGAAQRVKNQTLTLDSGCDSHHKLFSVRFKAARSLCTPSTASPSLSGSTPSSSPACSSSSCSSSCSSSSSSSSPACFLLLLFLLLSLPPRLTITDSVERLPPRCLMPPIQNHAAAAAQKSVVIPARSKKHQE